MSEPIRVLLVDDQELFREGVRVIVDAQEGMAVVGTAADGVEAVQLELAQLNYMDEDDFSYLPQRAGPTAAVIRQLLEVALEN